MDISQAAAFCRFLDSRPVVAGIRWRDGPHQHTVACRGQIWCTVLSQAGETDAAET